MANQPNIILAHNFANFRTVAICRRWIGYIPVEAEPENWQPIYKLDFLLISEFLKQHMRVTTTPEEVDDAWVMINADFYNWEDDPLGYTPQAPFHPHFGMLHVLYIAIKDPTSLRDEVQLPQIKWTQIEFAAWTNSKKNTHEPPFGTEERRARILQLEKQAKEQIENLDHYFPSPFGKELLLQGEELNHLIAKEQK
ncbi:MAG: hypothetical protein Q9212_002322 [Teloschistes hypoglaucus]